MIQVWSMTDAGLYRKENQDAYAVRERTDSGHTVCVVCDGMGGSAGGQMASRIAADTFLSEIEKLLKPEMTPEQLLEELLGNLGLEITDTMPAQFFCNCSKERVEKGERRFDFADDIDYDRLAKLKGLIHEMNNARCTVIICLPPFAHEIYSMMATSDGHKHLLQSFEQSVHQAADDEGVYFFDYSDMAWLGATDDEALDGFHGSERVYARMCLSMSSNPELQWMFDTDYLKTHLASPVDDMHIVPFDEMHYVK